MKSILKRFGSVVISSAIILSTIFSFTCYASSNPEFDELSSIPRHEIRDLRLAEDYVPPAVWVCPLSDSELDLFAALVMAEAGDQDYIGKCLVADVVLNRVESPAWPNTVTDVIYQRNQFSPTFDGGLERGYATVTSDCYAAILQELEGPRIDYNIIYFSMWYCANGTFVYQHGDHFFGV